MLQHLMKIINSRTNETDDELIRFVVDAHKERIVHDKLRREKLSVALKRLVQNAL